MDDIDCTLLYKFITLMIDSGKFKDTDKGSLNTLSILFSDSGEKGLLLSKLQYIIICAKLDKNTELTYLLYVDMLREIYPANQYVQTRGE